MVENPVSGNELPLNASSSGLHVAPEDVSLLNRGDNSYLYRPYGLAGPEVHEDPQNYGLPAYGAEARANLAVSMFVDPDKYGRAITASRNTGIPVETAYANPREAELQSAWGQVDWLKMMRDAPMMRFLSDTDAARIAHDDLPHASRISNAISFLSGSVESSLYGGLSTASGTLDKTLPSMRLPLAEGTFNPFNQMARWAHIKSREALQSISPEATEEYVNLQYATLEWNKAAWASPVRLLSMAPSFVPLIFAPELGAVGGASLLTGMNYLSRMNEDENRFLDLPRKEQEAAPEVQSYIRQGYSPDEAISAAAKDIGMAAARANLLPDFISNALGMKFLGGLAGKSPAKRISGGAAILSGTQAVQRGAGRILDNTVCQQYVDPHQSLLHGAGESAAQGLALGLLSGPLAGVAHDHRARDAEETSAHLANVNALRLEELNRMAGESKIQQRDPQTFAGLAEESARNGPFDKVYIDAHDLLQSGVADQVARLSPSVAEQVQTALKSNGQIAIPIGEYASRIAPTQYAPALVDHLRIDPKGFDSAEAKDILESQDAGASDNSVEKMQAAKERREMTEEIRRDIENQLKSAGRFKDNVNSSYALLVSRFYSSLAERLGVSPKELYGTHPLRITAGVASGEEKPSALLQDTRGFFNPETSTITLLDKADLSTFLHEAAHFFLETHSRVADSLYGQKESGEAGRESLLQDWETTLDWLGMEGHNGWKNAGEAVKRAAHEKFAQGFERYLFEGKAPDSKLRGMFRRFRAWLVSNYKDIKALGGNINDDIRGVFDRLLASDDQIGLTQRIASMQPLFATHDEAGMTPEEFSEYRKLHDSASAEAVEKLQSRAVGDMAWLRNKHNTASSRLRSVSGDLFKMLKGEAERNIETRPEYQAWKFFSGQEEDAPRLDSQGVWDIIRGSQAARRKGGKKSGNGQQNGVVSLKKADYDRLQKRGLLGEPGEGIHPGIAAERFGFDSGYSLVLALSKANKNRKSAALKEARQRMINKYGELTTPEGIVRLADKAVYNPLRERVLETEEKALSKALGSPSLLNEAARTQAVDYVSGLRLKDITVARFSGAASRAAKRARDALAKGDLQAAAEAKRQQIVQHYAAREAMKVLSEADKRLAYLKKFGKENVRKALSADYYGQIRTLLDRFDLRRSLSSSGKKEQKDFAEREKAASESLQQWLETQREAGLSPDVPDFVMRDSFRKPWKELTPEEFQGLVDTIKQIDHMGRAHKSLLLSEKKDEFSTIRDTLAASIIKYSKRKTPLNPRSPSTAGEKYSKGVNYFISEHIKVANQANIMDGGRDGGPVWEYIIQPANKRAEMETTMRSEATRKLAEIFGPILERDNIKVKEFFPSINRGLTHSERLAAALNTGNKGNMQRLLDGEGWSAMQVSPVLASLDSADWKAVQAIWDQFESYRPLVAAKEKRLYGKEPEWVTPTPFSIRASDGVTVHLKGGYYPVRYDPVANSHGEAFMREEEIRRLTTPYTTTTTRRSFTRTRADEVKGRPLFLSLDVMYSGINEVIHDLSWHEWLIDTQRLLRSGPIDDAIRNYRGPDIARQFREWMEDIAVGDRGAVHTSEKILSFLRRSATTSAMAFNFKSSFLQITGIFNGFANVGPGWILKGAVKYLSNPARTTRDVHEMSPYMADRVRTQFMDLNEIRNKINSPGAAGKVSELYGRYGYWMILRMQQIVDVQTWLGANEKHLANGEEEQRARDLADQAVIDAQGSGLLKDQAGIERGAEHKKFFTTFYSFFNAEFNLLYRSWKTKSKVRFMMDTLFVVVPQVVLGDFLFNKIIPGDSDKKDDSSVFGQLAKLHLAHFFSLFVYSRELNSIFQGFDYKGPTGLKVIGDFGKLFDQGKNIDWMKVLHVGIDVAGDFSGLPSAQINKTLKGAQALGEGKTDNPLALFTGYHGETGR